MDHMIPVLGRPIPKPARWMDAQRYKIGFKAFNRLFQPVRKCIMHHRPKLESGHRSVATIRSFRLPGDRAGGFTLPEMLAVVAIISIIISILLPAMRKARESAVLAQCLSDKRQILIALRNYALDNRSALPTRNPVTGYGYPHQMRRTSNGPYDLNKPFINPYIGDRAFLFCPGLSTTTKDLNDNWATSQYHVFPKDVFWIVPRPNLSKINMINGRAPLWSCFTRIKGGLYDSHGHNALKTVPKGMVAGFSDGTAEWVEWKNTEGYWQSGEVHYWPIYRE